MISANSKTKLLVSNIYVEWDKKNFIVYTKDEGIFDAIQSYLFNEGFLDNLPDGADVIMF